MGSGKRASMREGPLAALFRKTETDGLEPPAEARAPVPEPAPQHAPPPASEATGGDEGAPRPPARVPTPQERLRHAFSSDLPENMMSPPPAGGPPAAPSAVLPAERPRRSARRSCAWSASAAPASTRSTG